jgi:RimJ/RimL family protein N-acetyltransferase/SAM-dependent methyltransferase
VILSGRRVILRPATVDDVARLTSIRGEPLVAQRWGELGDREIEEDYIGDDRVFVVEADGEVIGAIQYEEEEDPMYRHAGIDIFLTTTRHDQGFGSEAVGVLARYLIHERGHHRLTVDPAADNAAAIRAYEKVGFRAVGVMRSYERGPDGTWHDGLLMEMLADELTYMAGPDPDEWSKELASESLATGDPTAWFEQLYAAAELGEAVVPWDRGAPRLLLVQWAEARQLDGEGKRALVVGCGFGDDAEYVAALGFETVAFDVAPSAVRSAERRFPDSSVEYIVADLLDPPARWRGAFDLVVESHTVQSLPDPPRRDAISQVARMVGPGGTLIVIAAARDEGTDPVEGPPWPLTRDEIDAFATGDLQPVQIEDMLDPADPDVRRWRAEFHRHESD